MPIGGGVTVRSGVGARPAGVSVAESVGRGVTVEVKTAMRVGSAVAVSAGLEVKAIVRVGDKVGGSDDSGLVVRISVTGRNGVVGVGVAVSVAVAVAEMVVGVPVEKVGVSVAVDGGSRGEAGVGVGVAVSVVTGVKSKGQVSVSWAAQVAVLPRRSIWMPTSNKEATDQLRSNGLAFMLSPPGCKATLKMRPGLSTTDNKSQREDAQRLHVGS